MELALLPDPHIYIAGLKTFKEFGSINEGGASLHVAENVLELSLTKGTGTSTGTVEGPAIAFSMDLNTNEILKKEFIPAPDFEDPEQSQFSGEVLEISEKRLVEIGLFFKEKFDTYL